jgi:transcriptional regulator with XRE-family HTH domain
MTNSKQNPSDELPDLPEFKDRIIYCAKKVGGTTALATKADLARRTVGQYMSGDSEPTRPKLIEIARVADVPIAWLATGEHQDNLIRKLKFQGSVIREEPGVYAVTNYDLLLSAVVEETEKAAKKSGLDIQPQQKGLLISIIHGVLNQFIK